MTQKILELPNCRDTEQWDPNAKTGRGKTEVHSPYNTLFNPMIRCGTNVPRIQTGQTQEANRLRI